MAELNRDDPFLCIMNFINARDSFVELMNDLDYMKRVAKLLFVMKEQATLDAIGQTISIPNEVTEESIVGMVKELSFFRQPELGFLSKVGIQFKEGEPVIGYFLFIKDVLSIELE